MEYIKMALGVKEGLILFIKNNEDGLYIGTKENYQTLGEYTGQLIKIANNTNNYYFHLVRDILAKADEPKYQKLFRDFYFKIQEVQDEN